MVAASDPAVKSLLAAFLFSLSAVASAIASGTSPAPLPVPEPGEANLFLLTPTILQVRLITGGNDWSQVAAPFSTSPESLETLPLESWDVRIKGETDEARSLEGQGLWKMPVFAGYHNFDLRVEWRFFLRLREPIPEDAEVLLRNATLFPEGEPLDAKLSADRTNPLFHISDFGFAPQNPKFGFVSYHLGTLGELNLPKPEGVAVVDSAGRTVLEIQPNLRSSPDWEFDQHVWKLDFSDIRHSGTYRLRIDGLGVSHPFRVAADTLLIAPRLLAGALYVQRSGWSKAPPFTRYAHKASHMAPAEIPDASESFKATNKHLAAMAAKNTDEKAQTAPVLRSMADALFPSVRSGSIDVSGGHYDAGDYSKYTINSAQLIHYLTFAVDHLPGVAGVDNLGIPESGDRIPDALQIALHEARFLLKMQDHDGGFYFLVYPRNRPYELDVLPEQGDPQVVFPKNTSATAAAVGALAQLASSPALRAFDPELARQCADSARRGHGFLSMAREKFGFAGSYQTVSHYGNFAGHRDEWAYAAAAMFVLTGEKKYESELREVWPDPTSAESKRWNWWGLPESFGAAARVYAFGEAPGFLPAGSLDASYSRKIKETIRQTADTWLDLSDADAFGVPFSRAAKRQKRAGWFWVMEPALDVACEWLLNQDAAFIQRARNALALWSAFEGGGNPLNQPFFTGIGSTWRQHAVNRITLNDDRSLAVPGIPIGNIVSTPHNLRPYQIEGRAGLRSLFTPSLDAFPFFERSGTDAYNVREEWTIATGGRLLAGHLFLLGQARDSVDSPGTVPQLSIQLTPEKPKRGEAFTASLKHLPNRDFDEVRYIWELIGDRVQGGSSPRFVLEKTGPQRIEVEVLWPDGLRASAVRHFEVEP